MEQVACVQHTYVAVRSKRLKSTLKVVTQYLMAGEKLRNCIQSHCSTRALCEQLEITSDSERKSYMSRYVANVQGGHQTEGHHKAFAIARSRM